MLEATLDTLWAIATAVGSVRIVATVAASVGSSAGTNRHWYALDDAIGGLARPLSRVITVVGRKVPTNHKGLDSCTVSSQLFRLVRYIGTILSVVDSNLAEVSVAATVGLVQWIRPLAALANACSGVYMSVMFLFEHTRSIWICTYTRNRKRRSTYLTGTFGRTWWLQ